MRRIVCCLFVAAFSLTGCSGDESEQFPVKQTPEIREDGRTVLRRGNGAEPESLDPHQARSVPAANILRDLYSGLVQLSPAGDIEPADAKSWAVGEEGLIYTFKLRENARWSNGQPVTAQDYVYSLRRSVDPATGSPYAQLHAPIVNAKAIIAGAKPPESLGVRALDAHTLEITLKAPTPYFLGTLAHSISYPVYRPAVEAHDAAFTQPGNSVTNGAYTMAGWRVNSMIALERNPQYWDDENTAIGRVQYYPITNENSALSRYQAGELDWATKVPISQYEKIKKHIPAQFKTEPTLGIYYYGLNLRRPPFKDSPKLRQALSMAIDRRVIVDKITRGDEIPAYGWIPPVVEGYAGAQFEWTKLSTGEREAKARKLYEAAGYGENKPLKIEIRYNSGEGNKKIASVVASMWRSVLGAEVTLRNQEWKVFLDSVRQGTDTEAYRLAWIGDYNDPNTFFELMNSSFGLNGTGYASDEYDRLQEKQAHMPAGPERNEVMKKAEATLLADSPVIPIYFYTSKYLIKDYVKGFEGNPLDAYYSKDLAIEP